MRDSFCRSEGGRIPTVADQLRSAATERNAQTFQPRITRIKADTPPREKPPSLGQEDEGQEDFQTPAGGYFPAAPCCGVRLRWAQRLPGEAAPKPEPQSSSRVFARRNPRTSDARIFLPQIFLPNGLAIFSPRLSLSNLPTFGRGRRAEKNGRDRKEGPPPARSRAHGAGRPASAVEE